MGKLGTVEIIPSCPSRVELPVQLGQKISFPHTHPHAYWDTPKNYCKARKSRSQSKYIEGPGKSVRTVVAPTDSCVPNLLIHSSKKEMPMQTWRSISQWDSRKGGRLSWSCFLSRRSLRHAIWSFTDTCVSWVAFKQSLYFTIFVHFF